MAQHRTRDRRRASPLLLALAVVVAACTGAAPAQSSQRQPIATPRAAAATPAPAPATAVAPRASAAAPATSPPSPAVPAGTPVASAPATRPTPAPASVPAGLILVRQPLDQWNHLYLLAAADGSMVQTIGTGVDAGWAPDGASVLLATWDRACVPHLSTISVKAGRDVAVTATLRAGDHGFAWSPDGSHVAFVRYEHGMPARSCGSQGGMYAAEELVSDIVVMGVNGRGQHVVVHATWPDFLAWSPDGTRIAFLRSVSPLSNGGTEHAVVDVSTAALTTLDRIHGGPVSWSPDGRWLAFLATTGTAANIGLARIDGTALRTLYGTKGRATGTFAWSPDGSTIAAFASRLDDAGGTTGDALVLLDVATGAMRDLRVDDGDGSLPLAWSPDGRSIAFVRQVPGGPPGPLTLVDVASGVRRSIEGMGTSAAWPEWFAWQPPT